MLEAARKLVAAAAAAALPSADGPAGGPAAGASAADAVAGPSGQLSEQQAFDGFPFHLRGLCVYFPHNCSKKEEDMLWLRVCGVYSQTVM